jgi:murein DD-endopeptidase MepM/ murein hydrolase activator NlpD
MSRNKLARTCGACVMAFVTVGGGTAFAGEQTGGMAAAETPVVEEVTCSSTGTGTCAPGDVLEVRGEALDGASVVVFMGGRSRGDDRRARPQTKRPRRLTVRVPSSARSGPLQIAATHAGRSRPSTPVRVTAKVAAATPSTLTSAGVAEAFPIRGPHTYGTEINRFGGGRNHKGQDVFAKCGTPIVAALAGEVTMAKWQDRAGNYAVITADDGTSQAYMHMRAPASVKRGDRVEAGQQIGEVGDTGRASGCHLHFELWTAPGWYQGGEAIDPLPFLQRLDR